MTVIIIIITIIYYYYFVICMHVDLYAYFSRMNQIKQWHS